MNHRNPPRFAVVFYRQHRRARWFKFATWALAVEAADRFAERLDAAAVIFDLPAKRATIA